MADMREMHADLVRASREKPQRKDRVAVLSYTERAVFGDRPLAVLGHDAFHRALAFSSDRQIDAPCLFFGNTACDGGVDLFKAPRLHIRREPCRRVLRFCDQHDARGISVKARDRAENEILAHIVHHGVCKRR